MLGAVWLAERPGAVTAEFRGWRLDTSVGALVVGIVVLILVSIGLWLLYRWIVGAPGALLEGWGDSRRRRGYRELTQGLAAVAAGDGTEAQKHARKAEKLLAEPALTLLLSAQAAQLTGDRDGSQARLQRHARRRADGLPRPARPDRPGVARRRPGAGAGLCRARLPTAAADAVGGAFAVRHAGADRPVEGGAGDARHGPAPQGRDAEQGPHPEGAAAGRAQPRRRARRPAQPMRWPWRARLSAWRRNASPSAAGWPSCRSRRATASARSRRWSAAGRWRRIPTSPSSISRRRARPIR